VKKLKKLIKILEKKKLSLGVVESCTGGYLSYLLTKTSGSSKVFKGGFIAYSLDIKNKYFKIPLSLLKRTFGVSKDIALELGEKIRKLFHTDIGASIVGFAGPKARKGLKVGTVFLSVVDKNKKVTKKIIIKGNRDTVRKKASYLLIDLLLESLFE
jgi:PncC family amidohydrolase